MAARTISVVRKREGQADDVVVSTTLDDGETAKVVRVKRVADPRDGFPEFRTVSSGEKLSKEEEEGVITDLVVELSLPAE